MRHPYASAKRTTDARVAIGAKDIATLTIALLALFVSAIALWAQFFREESNLHLAVPQVFFHFETNEDGTTTGNTFENGVFSRSIIGEYNIAFLDTGNRPVLVKYVNQSIIDITSKNFLLLHDIDARRGDELSKQHLSLDKQQKIVQKYNQEKLNNAPPCVTVIAYPIPSPTDPFHPIIVKPGEFNLLSLKFKDTREISIKKDQKPNFVALLACLHIEYVFSDGTEGVDDIPIKPITVYWQEGSGLVIWDWWSPIIPPLYRIGRQVRYNE